MRHFLIGLVVFALVIALTLMGLNAYTNGVLFACFAHCWENGQMPSVVMYETMAEICA